MKKRLVSLLLSAALLTAAASAAAWPDWAYDAKTWAERNGLGAAFLDAPNAKVTRGQAAQLLYEAAGSPPVSEAPPYTDVPEQYADAVAWAAQNGFVRGVGQNRYLPDQLVSRQEFAVILHRGAGSPAAVGTLDGYLDAESVAPWAREAMRWCVGAGFMKGKTADRLAPGDTIAVTEAVLMLQRADAGAGDNSEQPAAVSTAEELKAQLAQAIAAIRQPPALDVSALPEPSNLVNTVKNLYYALLSEHPEYKYAYDIRVEYESGGLLRCTFSYMPYRTGQYPDGFQGVAVSSLQQLLQTARGNLSQGSLPIRISNTALTVDHMNKVLQQAGGSYLLCELNRDGTEITFTPQGGLSAEACLAKLDSIDALAQAAVRTQLNDGMTEYEKAETLYTYLTDTVRYDQRYYSDPANLPYASMTAYGALNDHLAICGGYAQALQALFETAGIPCYTVTGSMGSEHHMWNVALMDGEWRYFDATSDRGRADHGFQYFGAPASQLTRYTWDIAWTEQLCGLDP